MLDVQIGKLYYEFSQESTFCVCGFRVDKKGIIWGYEYFSLKEPDKVLVRLSEWAEKEWKDVKQPECAYENKSR